MARRRCERGWESLPIDAQSSLIKSEYYLVPTRDAWALARLLGEGAVAPGSAAAVPEDRAMCNLVGSGHVRRAAPGRFYLAGDGPMLAREIRDVCPEIDWEAFERPGGSTRRALELVKGAAVGMRPPASRRMRPDARATARKKLIYLFRARRRQWK